VGRGLCPTAGYRELPKASRKLPERRQAPSKVRLSIMSSTHLQTVISFKHGSAVYRVRYPEVMGYLILIYGILQLLA
jgi:hypothetical protein